MPIFDEGAPIPNGRLRVWVAGSTTPATVYADPGMTIPLPNPVAVGGDWLLPPMFGVGAFRLRGEDSTGRALFEVARVVIADPLPAEEEEAPGPPTTSFQTGDLKHRYGAGTHPGWVRANGRTIGSANSGATERAALDCRALFLHLWDADSTLTVSGGRGASAQADWSADKTIALPDARGRALTGVDGMGGGTSARLSNGLFATGSATALGGAGGEASHALVTAELARHGHGLTVNIAAGGAHQHVVDVQAGGDHNHAFAYTIGNVAGGNGANAVTGIGPTGAIGTGTGNGGTHGHSASTQGAGEHSHGVTASLEQSGTGQPFNLLSPFLLVTLYVKL